MGPCSRWGGQQVPKHGDRKVQVQSPSGCTVLTGCGKGVGDKTGKGFGTSTVKILY